MILTLAKLAEITSSTIKGDADLKLAGVTSLDEAKSGDISFVSNPKYKKYLSQTKASAIILSPALAESYSGNALVNPDPYLTFAKVVFAFHGEEKKLSSIHPSAIISATASVATDVVIGAHVVIEADVVIEAGVTIGAGSFIGKNSVIKKDSYLYPNVTLYKESKIGARVIIHSGCIIGADGFGFAPQKDKQWYKILQIGNVVIGSDVEIGANTTIDRAALGSTIIANGVKLDNQVQIGHNVEIGDHTIIAAGTMIAGSTVVGKYCQFGGVVAIAGHLNIADGVIVTGRGMVTNSIKKAGVYSSGIALEENNKWRRNAARFRKLDEMAKTVRQLQKKIEGK